MAVITVLRCVGSAAAKCALKALVKCVPLGEALLEVGNEAWRLWKEEKRAEDRLKELEQVARLTAAQLETQIHDVVAEVAADQSAAEREVLVRYLRTVPATVQRRLRHPSDPSGTTIPPGLQVDTPEELIEFLPDRPSRFTIGQRIPGWTNWVLEKPLGVGGFGEVWLARNPFYPIPSAFKFCLNADLVRSLRADATNLSRLIAAGQMSGVVRLEDVHLDNEVPFVKLEYVAGGELTSLIQQWHQDGKGPSPERAAQVILRLAQIVSQFHRLDPPLVHRDLKPANILVESANGKTKLKIADFGIGAAAAKTSIRQSTLTRGTHPATYSVKGSYTPIYASPEQMRGGDPDPRDDVHALGVIWYHILTGALDHEVPNDWPDELVERDIELPPAMLELLKSSMAGRASRRPVDAAALAERLRQLFVTNQPLAAPKSESTTRSPATPPLKKTMPKPQSWPSGTVIEKPVEVEPTKPTLLVAPFSAAAAKEKQQAWAKYLRLPAHYTNRLGMRFQLIPPGQFRRGSTPAEIERILQLYPDANKVWLSWEQPARSITISQAKYVGVYQVTRGQFRQFLQDSGIRRSEAERDGQGGWGWNEQTGWFEGPDPKYNWSATGFAQTDEHPVVNVTWNDAQQMVQWLNQADSQKPTGYRYRLLTEAEWEYAARSGTSAIWQISDDPEDLVKIGNVADATAERKWVNYPGINYLKSSDGHVFNAPVGCFQPNSFGLYDMIGNVWEWCEDWFDAKYYVSAPATDPRGPATGAHRVFRGGSYGNGARNARPAARNLSAPENRGNDLGFRFVLVPEP